MILFSWPKSNSWNDFCYCLRNLRLCLLGYRFLFFRVIKNSAPVLSSTVSALAIQRSGIMFFKEQIHQLLVRNFFFVINHLHRFGMPSCSGTDLRNRLRVHESKLYRILADLIVSRIRGCTSDVSNRCVLYTRSPLIHKLHTPKASSRKGRKLIAFFNRRRPCCHFSTLRTHSSVGPKQHTPPRLGDEFDQ